MSVVPKFSAEHQAVRDTLINEAVRAGKILPSRTQHYQRLYDSDPQGTTAILNLLAPVPGLAASAPASGAASASSYDESWLSPSERTRVGNARRGQRSVIDSTQD